MDRERVIGTHHQSPITNHSAQPWFREPWPWLLMAGPAAAIIAGVVTMWLAVASADGVVADDYYKRGLAINRDIDRDRAAAAAGVTADLMVSGSRFHVRLGGSRTPEVLFAQFVHPTRAGLDQRLRLTRAAGGLYQTELPELARGRWRVILEDPRGEWRIVKEWP